MTFEGGLHTVCHDLYIVTNADLGGHDIEAEDFKVVTVQNYLTG
jgi:hypothetical protein